MRRAELLGVRSMNLTGDAAERALKGWLVTTHGDRRRAAEWLDKLQKGEFNQSPAKALFQSQGQRQTDFIPPARSEQDGLPPQSWELTLDAAGTNDGGILLYTVAFAFPDTGPIIVTFSLVKLDPTTGSEVWRYISSGSLDNKWALHPDGTLYMTERLAACTQVLAFDSLTGQIKFAIPLPSSSHSFPACAGGFDFSETRPPIVGPYMVALDNSVYLDYPVLNWKVSCAGGGTTLEAHESLNLLHIQPDGTSSSTTLREFDRVGPGGLSYYNVPYFIDYSAPNNTFWLPLFGAGELVPDGQGGIIAGWSDLEGYWYSVPLPVTGHVMHVGADGSPIGDYPMVLDANMESSGMMVVGDNNTAYVTDQNTVYAFDVNSRAVQWSWQPSQGWVRPMAAAADGQLVMANFIHSNLAESVVRLDASGNATYDPWLAPTAPLAAAAPSSENASSPGVINQFGNISNVQLAEGPVLGSPESGPGGEVGFYGQGYS